MAKKRKFVQLGATLLQNINLKGFATGRLYTGKSKAACVPGLNCYSCPGAVGACPVGSLQNSITKNGVISFYVVGFLLLVGLVLGRFVCGFLCPFGFLQDLLYKIPTPKFKKRRWFRHLTKVKYGVLAIFVLGIPLYLMVSGGVTFPAFCKYICPAGTLEAGIPLLTADSRLRGAAGLLFIWKLGLLVIIIGWALFRYRAFCRVLCPLGAIYSLFNKISLLQIHVDEALCIECDTCVKVCPMDAENTASPECIRCGKCVKACPQQAMSWRFGKAAKPYEPAKNTK